MYCAQSPLLLFTHHSYACLLFLPIGIFVGGPWLSFGESVLQRSCNTAWWEVWRRLFFHISKVSIHHCNSERVQCVHEPVYAWTNQIAKKIKQSHCYQILTRVCHHISPSVPCHSCAPCVWKGLLHMCLLACLLPHALSSPPLPSCLTELEKRRASTQSLSGTRCGTTYRVLKAFGVMTTITRKWTRYWPSPSRHTSEWWEKVRGREESCAVCSIVCLVCRWLASQNRFVWATLRQDLNWDWNTQKW